VKEGERGGGMERMERRERRGSYGLTCSYPPKI
jgi:hypothetical protein